MEPTELQGIRPEILDLEWIAEYIDGTGIKQNYGKGEANGEKHFGHIDQELLEWFWLVDQENGEKHFGINMQRQAILIGDVTFYVEFPRNKDGEKVAGKLVYFRRIRNGFAPDGIITTVTYCIGLQANIDGRNHQQYLFINMDGTFTLSQQK